MNELFEKIYAASNINTEESRQTELFERIYNESEMLNEMNPKLRALLAAGLIGTASLGAASCSMPTDDPYIPAIENTDEENKETQMSAWKELGISEADWNNIMAPATKVKSLLDVGNAEPLFLYATNVKKYAAGSGFISITPDERLHAGVYYFQKDTKETPGFVYFIPGDQVQQFYAKGAKQPVAK